MTQASNYLENAIVNHLTLGGSAFSLPSVNALQFHTADPGEDCTASVFGDNRRTALTFGSAASARAISNTAQSQLATLTAGGTVTHWSVWDSATAGAGNPLYYGALTSSRVVTVSDDLTIPIGEVDLSLDSVFALATANALLDHITGRATHTQPAALYVQAHTGAPGDAGASNPATTSTRLAVSMGAASGGTCTSDADVSGTAAATETISHFSFHDALTSGNPLWVSTATTAKQITNGQAYRIPSGDLSLSFA